METLNEYYPLYPDNPETAELSEIELAENHEYITNLEKINDGRRNKKPFSFEDFCLKHSDNLWYLWCIINEFTDTNSSRLLNRMDYPKFCAMCFENSCKT